MTHRQGPYGDSLVGIGDGGKEVEGGVDQLMSLGECETVYGSSAFEQWDPYWEDLTRYETSWQHFLHQFKQKHFIKTRRPSIFFHLF